MGRRRSSAIGRVGGRVASALLSFCVAGCFGVAWETGNAWDPERAGVAASSEAGTRISAPLRLEVEYVEGTNSSIRTPEGASLVRAEIEKGLEAPFHVLNPASHARPRGVLKVRCGDPSSEVTGLSAFGVLLTLGVLPAVSDFTVACNAALRDGDGKLLWHSSLERRFRAVASALPYTYLIPGTESAGLFGYPWMKRTGADTVVEFAHSVGEGLDAERVDLARELLGGTPVALRPTASPPAEPKPPALLPSVARRPDQRLALVIGNAEYAAGPLANPARDAADLAAKLGSLGFEVTLLRDAPQTAMETAVRELGERLRAGGVGLFYFAGHGVQLSGENYLIPVGGRLESETDARYRAVSASWVVETLEAAGNGINLVILDACRDNPFARSWRSANRGLAVIRARGGTLIAYSTAPGQTAADGDARNSPYTMHLLDALDVPGLPVELVFKRVGAGVQRDTGGTQIPWVSSSLTRDFTFRPE